MNWTRESVVEGVVKQTREHWEYFSRPIKFEFIARRWNRTADRLEIDLRELVKSEPRLRAWPTKKDGTVVFPIEQCSDEDWTNMLTALDLPIL